MACFAHMEKAYMEKSTYEPQSVKTSLNDEVLKFYLLTYI